MELTGRIIAVMEPRGGVSARTGNSWKTQEYVLEVPGQYPRRCVFNIFGEDRINQFNIQQGEDLTIQFDIDARADGATAPFPPAQEPSAEGSTDDLPF